MFSGKNVRRQDRTRSSALPPCPPPLLPLTLDPPLTTRLNGRKGPCMMPASAEPTSRLLLSSLRSAVQIFQSLRNDIPINMVVLFLLIAERGRSVGAAELVKLAGVSHASVSRNLQALGHGKVGEPGLGLVTKTIDPDNPRAHAIHLTKEGRALAARMVDELAAPLMVARAAQVALEPFSGAHWEVWVD